jgi:cytochrome c-type biogenesis protein CcmE
MTHRYIKIGVTSAVLVLAFTGLLWSTLQDGTEYFKHVDEVVANRQAFEGRDMQLHGYVVPGSIYRSKENQLQYIFKVQNNPARSDEPGSVINASYTGVVPDTFQAEAEVVLHGRLSADGGFHADNVIAKCPSKYEAKSTPAYEKPVGSSGGADGAGL